MKIAAYDLGSNSVHLVLVEVDRSGSFRVIGREKDMVRLGQGALGRGRLTSAAMGRALKVLGRYRRLAEAHGVEKTLAVATSAVREATNGEDFLDRVGREVGIWPKAISGDEEARLIYLAALHSVHLEGRRALVVDIGGGSVELALGAGEELRWGTSLKLGVLRMTEQFVASDPLSTADQRRLVRHVDDVLEPHLRRLAGGFDTLIGTSGTVLALGEMALSMEGRPLPSSLHHVTVKSESLQAARRWLASSAARERAEVKALQGRADIAVAGAVVLGRILDHSGAGEIVLCEWALREGLILDYVHGHERTLARAEAYPDVRRRSVMSLAERCQYDAAHARQVADLALSLFDQTRRRHGLGEPQRALLEYAALLHDIGHHISYPGHHKHTYYLIRNGNLRGFDPLELEVLANVARYHRRSRPRRSHAGYGALPREAREVVKVLAAHLRLADALDRSHRQFVRGLTVTERGRALKVVCAAAGDCELELWGAGRRKDLLERVLEVDVRVEAGPAAVLPRAASAV